LVIGKLQYCKMDCQCVRSTDDARYVGYCNVSRYEYIVNLFLRQEGLSGSILARFV
jgi:hypothetical protein